MALQIGDPALVAEILAESEQRKISPDEVVRQALADRRKRAAERYERIMKYLAEEVWPHIPPNQLGNRLTKEEADILGYDENGLCS